MMPQVFTGADVFDGAVLHRGAAVVVADGCVVAICAQDRAPRGDIIRLAGGILAPGMIDLQVNGGDGVMLGAAATVGGIARICAAHGRLGSTGLLATLITDRPEVTQAVIAAGIAAARAQVPGFLGLHLEGPHLDPRRKGAHDPGLIRPMQADDLALLLHAAAHLPHLMVTVAPEAVTLAQIAALSGAGVVVSLGHSDCTAAVARAAMAAGAACATHLFNAMSPLGHREPGLVGAVLDGAVLGCRGFAGMIADGIHVAPEALRIALAAKPWGLFVVTDAMAVAGTSLQHFTLGGRTILRRGGRLTLEDGTLAGADCTLPGCVGHLVGIGVAPERALAMATSVPAASLGATSLGATSLGATCLGATGLGATGVGSLGTGLRADMVHLGADFTLQAVWRAGVPIAPEREV